jgi:hypothetical protein
VVKWNWWRWEVEEVEKEESGRRGRRRKRGTTEAVSVSAKYAILSGECPGDMAGTELADGDVTHR